MPGDDALPGPGQVIALSLEPKAPEKEIKIPDGSRSGIFAASPSGKVGAPGIPETVAAKDDEEAGGSGANAKPTDNAIGISITGGIQPAHASSAVVAGIPAVVPKNSALQSGGSLRTLMAKALK